MTDLTAVDADAATGGPLEITVTDEYHGTVDQQGLDAWELHQARIALALLTEALRGEPMVQLLRPWIEESDARARAVAAESNGEWGRAVESVFDVRGLTFDEFDAWFSTHLGDEVAMRAGNPDHYEIRIPENLITETIDGLPRRFMFQYESPIAPPDHFERDPEFPILRGEGRAVVSTLLDGVTINALGAGQQVRETADGFRMKMTLFFPAAAPESQRVDHLRHYAIEFSRWITMAYEAKRAAGDEQG